MEKFFSLNKLSSDIFTEGTKYKQASDSFSEHPKFLQNAIEESIKVMNNTSSYSEAALSDSLYRIKETEKDISKNALFSVYEHSVEVERGISEDSSKDQYINLGKSNVPCLDKLEEILTETSNTLDKFEKYATPDAGEEYLTFLKEECEKILENIDNVISDVLGTPVTDNSSFVEESIKAFRNTAISESIEEVTKSVSNECDDIVDGVADYNHRLRMCARKLRHAAALMDADASRPNFVQTDEIKAHKCHLLSLLCHYACKYMAHANIVHGFKATTIGHFLHPQTAPAISLISKPAAPNFVFDLSDKDDDEEFSLDEAMFEEDLDDLDESALIGDYVECEGLEDLESSYSNLESAMYLTESVILEAPQLVQQQAPAQAQQQPNPNETNVAKAADQGAAAGKQQMTPQQQKAEGQSIKGKIDAVIDINKKFFVRMMFRANKSAVRYSSFGKNYNINTIYSIYTKRGNSDSALYPTFKGDVGLAVQRIMNFFNTIRNKSLTNLAGKGDNSEEFFVSRISDANMNPKDIKMITDFFMGNDSGQVEVPFRNGTSREEFQNMIDIMQSAEMDQNKFANNINALMDEAARFSKTSVQEAVDYANRDNDAREKLASVLEDYFGDGYKAFSEAPEGQQAAPAQPQAAQQTQAPANNQQQVNSRGAEVVQVVTNYCAALKKVCAAAKTAHEAVLSRNKKILDLLQSGNPQRTTQTQQQQPPQQAQPAQQQQAPAAATNQ